MRNLLCLLCCTNVYICSKKNSLFSCHWVYLEGIYKSQWYVNLDVYEEIIRIDTSADILQLLLGYLPMDRHSWREELEKRRAQYMAFKNEFLLENTVCFCNKSYLWDYWYWKIGLILSMHIFPSYKALFFC